MDGIRIDFDRGTLRLDGRHAASMPGVVWDERVQGFRCAAYRYYAVVARAAESRLALDDHVSPKSAPAISAWRMPDLRPYQQDAVRAFHGFGSRPFATRLASPVRPIVVRVWADGDHVIANWKGRGVAQDGQPYQNSDAWILRMQAGKAVEVTAFLDLAPYDDVLRRIPTPAKQAQIQGAVRASAVFQSQTQEQSTP